MIDSVYLIEELNLIQNEIKGNLPFNPNMKSIHLWEKAILKAFSTNETHTFIMRKWKHPRP